MTSAQVLAGLKHRWPDAEYLTLLEAPQDSMRQGRKLDAVVVSLWNSRGHQLDGVEVKVSVADFRRELKAPGKADWWVRHVHRFWIACPADIVPKIRDDVPAGWGLLAVSGDRSREVIKAKRRDKPTPFTWNEVIGLLRCAADAGPNMLYAAEERGRRLGMEQGKAQAERERAAAEDPGRARAKLAELTERLEEFHKATGLDLLRGGRVERAAAAFNLANHFGNNPVDVVAQIERHARDLESLAAQLHKQAAGVVELGHPQPGCTSSSDATATNAPNRNAGIPG